MATEKQTLNRNASYDAVYGDDKVKFIQNGKMFGPLGEYVRDCPPAFLATGRKTIVAELAEQAGEKDDVLARARAKLSKAGETIPQAIINANKENAAAEAAEDGSD